MTPSHPLRAFLRICQNELRVLAADRSLWVIGVLFVALLGHALRNGLEQSRARDAAHAETLVQQARGQQAVRERWRRVMAGSEAPDPWSNPTDPSLVGAGLVPRYALLPSAPLAPLATGQSDMFPDTYRVTSESRVEFMYDSEIENPWNLLTGRFDAAFVITYLLPLFIFAWSYNFLAGEREQGTLRLLLSQPIGLRTLVLGKIAVRAAWLLGWAVAIPALALLAFRPEARSGPALLELAGWAASIAAYCLFWFAVAVLVDSFGKSSALNALILVNTWVLLVLIVPILLNLGASLASPAPSRAELATQTRLITIDNLEQLKDSFGTDYAHVHHPELLLPKAGRFEVSERLRAFFQASQRLDARIDTHLAAFDTQLGKQQAIVDRFGVLSPAILVHEGMAALAGNDTERYRRFQAHVTRFHGAWKQFFEPRISDGFAILDADFERMPRWSWAEEEGAGLARATAKRLLQLLGLGAAVWIAAWLRLRRYPVV